MSLLPLMTFVLFNMRILEKLCLLSPVRTIGRGRWHFFRRSYWIVFSTLIVIGALVGGVSYLENLNMPLPNSSTPSPSASPSSTPTQTPSPVNVKIPTSPTLAIRGLNNSVMYRTFNVSSGWNDWVVLPWQTADSPAAVLVGNELHIVIRDSENSLWYGYVNGSGVFSNLTRVADGATPSAPTLAKNATHLCLVVRGLGDDLVYYRFYELKSQKWTSWASFPLGRTSDSPAAVIYDGMLHVATRSINGSLIYYNNLNLSTGNFSGWESISGAMQSAPTLAANEAQNKVILMIRSSDNRVLRSTLNGLNWTDWVPSENVTTCDGPAATIISDKLYLVVRNIEGNHLWMQTLSLSGNQSLGLYLFPEGISSTSSKPTLAG